MGSGWKDSEHLLRLAGLFGAGILLFLGLQAVLVPADFGELGPYRTSALEANRQRPVAFAGEAACAECHADVIEARQTNRHQGVRCEACHGPQAAHAEGGPKPERPDAVSLCARCHERLAARPRAFPQVDVREHAAGERCVTCHTPHAPRLD